MIPVTTVAPETHDLTLWLRGTRKAGRGAPGARLAEVYTAPLHLPEADARGFRFGSTTSGLLIRIYSLLSS